MERGPGRAAAEDREAEGGTPGPSQGLAGAVEGALLVPLHVPDAPDRLDVRLLGSKLEVVLVVTLLKQALVPTVAGVLVAHPPAGGGQGQAELNPPLMQECPENQRPKPGALSPARWSLPEAQGSSLRKGPTAHPETYVPLCTRTEDTFSW